MALEWLIILKHVKGHGKEKIKILWKRRESYCNRGIVTALSSDASTGLQVGRFRKIKKKRSDPSDEVMA